VSTDTPADDCQCGRGPVVGLLTYTNSRVLFRAAEEGTPVRDQSAADLRCLDCATDAIAAVASGEVWEQMRRATRPQGAYVVAAYRGDRNWHLKRADYTKIVREESGKSPAKERADALGRELAERSHRQRLGWTRITVTLEPS
jgi:hypothetical protein